MIEFPVLIGDIGGTNARFALIPERGAAYGLLAKRPTAEHPDPSAAIAAALRQAPVRPRTALLAVATRVSAPVVHLTNAAWTIDAERIGRDLDLDRVVLMNDYVPVAAALADPEPEFSEPLGPAVPGDGGVRLVLGPGTGLGAAALVPAGERLAVLPTEAGHVEFGACEPEEFSLWPSLERAHGRLTSEAVLSGPGLVRLHRALASRCGSDAPPPTPAEIVARGLAGGDDPAAAALRLFARLLGRFAGDLALIFSATGGVFIAGGIAPRMKPVLAEGGFRAAFEHKAPFEHVVRAIPSAVIVDPEPGLTGLRRLATDPDRFLFDVREWRRPGAPLPDRR